MPEPTMPDSRQRCGEFAPVIEQAKGIIMAQIRCGPDEAFEILVRMSQHTNVKLRILAERMVQQMSLPDSRQQPTTLPPALPETSLQAASRQQG